MPDVDDNTDQNPIVTGSSEPVPPAAAEETPAEQPAVATSASTTSPDQPEAPEVPAEEQAPAANDERDEEEELPSEPSPAELNRVHPPPEQLSLDAIEDDESFKLRDEGDIAALATDIARLGQIFPIDVRALEGDRYQVITGFRRLAALRFLQRERVLARLHVNISDDDAALIALAEAIHSEPVTREELQGMQERLEGRGRLSAAVRDMFAKALADDDGLAPEEVGGEEEEVDADELAADVATRLGQINQDLSLLADVFAELDEERREMLLEQLRYSSQLVAFLEGKTEGDE